MEKYSESKTKSRKKRCTQRVQYTHIRELAYKREIEMLRSSVEQTDGSSLLRWMFARIK